MNSGPAKLNRSALVAALIVSNAACANPEQPESSVDAAAESTAVTETVAAAETPTATAEDYTRVCGICHLAQGEGVPGAFPPLDGRLAAYAASEAGRNYLVGILKNGLYGQITVNSTTYNGAMPPLVYQLDAEQMAGMLNYVLQTFAATEAGFSAKEVTDRQTSVGSSTGATLRKEALTDTQ